MTSSTSWTASTSSICGRSNVATPHSVGLECDLKSAHITRRVESHADDDVAWTRDRRADVVSVASALSRASRDEREVVVGASELQGGHAYVRGVRADQGSAVYRVSSRAR